LYVEAYFARVEKEQNWSCRTSAPPHDLEREMVMDEPLDFEEEEDPLFPAPRPTKRYRSAASPPDWRIHSFSGGLWMLRVAGVGPIRWLLRFRVLMEWELRNDIVL
jgi:hypothetical protein